MLDSYNTFLAASELLPPFLKRDQGARSFMNRLPALPISKTVSQAKDKERFS